MNVFLLFKDKDFKETSIDELKRDLIKDLALDTIADTMADGDEFIKNICLNILINPLSDEQTIVFRQNILKDAIANPQAFKELYNLAVDALESKEKSIFWMISKTPSSVLFSNLRMMETLIEYLSNLWQFAEKYQNLFESKGMKRFVGQILDKLNPDFLEEIKELLEQLEFKRGIKFRAKLGYLNRLDNFIVVETQKVGGIFKKIFSKEKYFSFTIDERDEAGFRTLSELKDKALKDIALTMFALVDHTLKFLEQLKREIAFYVGAVNLYNTLTSKGYPACFGSISAWGNTSFDELYNLPLALISNKKIVGNSLSLVSKTVIFITGANRGGKTVFLRSIGVAKIMFQAGLFVPAKQFTSHINNGIFTHFKREEDVELRSGKLDDELKRMDRIVNNLNKYSLVLFNESFASTNEQEGSEIASNILNALSSNEIESYYVTHMYSLVRQFLSSSDAEFLVAEVTEDGKRTYKIKPGKPSSTSRAMDLFKRIFES